MVEEYQFIIAGPTLVGERGNYTVGIYLDSNPIELCIAGSVAVDFERLYRQEITAVSPIQVRVNSLTRTRDGSSLKGYVGSLEDVVFPVPVSRD